MTNPVTQRPYLVANGTGTIFPTVVFPRAPAISDFDFPVTQRWIDTSDKNAEWFLLGYISSNGVVSPNWVKISSGGNTTESLTGNTGGPVGPDSNLTINVVGDTTSGIGIAGNPGTHTLTATLANIPNSSLINSSITLVAGSGISISTSPVSLGGSTTISATTPINAFNQVVIQEFTANGSYVPTPGMKYCIIECVGAGAGGGGVGAVVDTLSAGGGGGAGGYAQVVADSATIGVSKPVVVGVGGVGGDNTGTNGDFGGPTSVGAICVATGGNGAQGNQIFPPGGSGGAGMTGTVLMTGAYGGFGFGVYVTNYHFQIGGYGAEGPFGGSPGEVTALMNITVPGRNGVGPGSGGSGAAACGTAAGSAGGNGADGFVRITEFISV